jgi:uncharacterized protein YaaQ
VVDTQRIEKLILALVQPQDVDAALDVLRKEGLSPFVLQGGGGFLGREVPLLVAGMPSAAEEPVLAGLRRACRTRTEYISVPYEGAHLPLGAPVPIEVQGATVFLLDVERCEEYP